MIEAVHAIVPRFAHERAQRWKLTRSGRERGRAELAGCALRSFDLVWEPTERGRSFLWYGNGEAYQSLVSVATSYRGIPPDLLTHMLIADGVDLLRAFAQLPSTSSGISHFVELGLGQYEIDDAANAVVEHRFRVHWAQDTD